MTATVGDVIGVLEQAYPPVLAEPWDAVGLVCGDPAEPVEKALVCVDPTQATVDEAIDVHAQLLIAHHPLLLRGVHGVPADDPKGRLVHRLVRAGVALFCAHTNADVASPGVSDALAAAIGLTVTGALVPRAAVPADQAIPDRCGTGRIGQLAVPEPFAAFVSRVADALPDTAWGVRGAGDPARPIRTVAVCGGAGDSYLAAATSVEVDAYVTADLRHHPAAEHIGQGDVPGRRVPALVDVAHWASEWPWCSQAAEVLRSALGGTVDVLVSDRRTDPWTLSASNVQAAVRQPGRTPA